MRKNCNSVSRQLLNYKVISDVVWHGDLYRLVDPQEKPFIVDVCRIKIRLLPWCFLI